MHAMVVPFRVFEAAEDADGLALAGWSFGFESSTLEVISADAYYCGAAGVALVIRTMLIDSSVFEIPHLQDRLTPIHQPHNWTPTLASFKAPDPSELAVGVQLVVAGSDADRFFGPFRDALITSPTLLAEYNELKLRLDGFEYERYTEEKGQFIELVLRALNDRSR